MRRLLIALALTRPLVAAPSAFAGGWATVGLESTPAGVQPGEPWNVSITVLQHGRTPLEDVQPTLTICNGDATKTFAAKPTDKPGVYARAVVVPERREVDLRGQRRLHQPAAAHVPGRADRRAGERAAPRPTTTDDGGANLTGWLGRASRCCSRRPRCSAAPARRRPPAAGGVRATTLAAGGLACAGAAMTIAAFAAGGGSSPPAPPAPRRRRRRMTAWPCGSRRAAAPATRSRRPSRDGADRPGPRRWRCRARTPRLRVESIVAPTRPRPARSGTMPEDFATADRPPRPRTAW